MEVSTQWKYDFQWEKKMWLRKAYFYGIIFIFSGCKEDSRDTSCLISSQNLIYTVYAI